METFGLRVESKVVMEAPTIVLLSSLPVAAIGRLLFAKLFGWSINPPEVESMTVR